MSSRHYYCLVIVAICWLLIAPLMITFMIRAWKVKDTVIMQKRYINASLLCCVLLCLWLLVIIPTAPLVEELHVQHHDNLVARVLCPAHSIVRLFAMFGVSSCFLYRFWMIYSDFIYEHSMQQEHWKVHINPDAFSEKTHWIMRHRRDHGNPVWVRKRFIVCYCTLVSICAGVWAFGHVSESAFARFIDVLFGVPLALQVALWFKMPPFFDSLLIKTEFRAYLITFAVSFTLKIGLDIATTFVHVEPFYSIIALQVVALSITLAFVFIQTEYILIMMRKENDYYGHMLHIIGNEQIVLDRAHSSSAAHKKLHLRDALQDSVIFQLFLAHLSSELSTECLFAFIEFTQFRALLESDDSFHSEVREYLQKVRKQAASDTRERIRVHSLASASPEQLASSSCSSLHMILPDEHTVPLSFIVHKKYMDDEMKPLQRYKKIARDLQEKYISDESEYCININYESSDYIKQWVRQHCCDDSVMDITHKCALYVLFEPCRSVMNDLMTHAFQRFLQTPKLLQRLPSCSGD